MNKKLLIEKLAAITAEYEALLKASETASDVIAHLATTDAKETELNGIKAQLAAIESLEAKAKANVTRQPGRVITDNEAERPFESLGEQLAAIASASRSGNIPDRRLFLAASGGSATVPADGGYLIRTEFSTALLDKVQTQSALLSRCTTIPIGEGNDGVEIPYVDETSRVDGSRWGGVLVYRASEADAATSKKPQINRHEIRLESIKGLAYMTDRLLRNAPAMEAIYSKAFASEFAFKIDDEIIRGNGAGKCLGILNSGALVSVTKETGQAAATLEFDNIVKMRARLYSKSRPTAVWLINQDIEPALHTMSMPVGTGGVPVFLPAGGASATPFDRLFGMPVIPIEHAATLGTVGDIMLVDLSEYLIIQQGGLKGASSMHVRFIYDEMTFKWSWDINGQPAWKTPLTPYKGTATQSPFVALSTRA